MKAVFTIQEACNHVGGAEILAELEKDFGLRRFRDRHKFVRYYRKHIDAALERAAAKV